MAKIRTMVKKYKAVPVATGLVSVACTFPAFAADAGTSGGIAGMLSLFTQIAAWLWSEVGLFCKFVFDQPLLMLAFAIPFVGLVVNFFIRIFKTA